MLRLQLHLSVAHPCGSIALLNSVVDPDPQGSVIFAGCGSVNRGFRMWIRVHIQKWMQTLTKNVKKGVFQYPNFIILTILIYSTKFNIL
jgi:hypothetical protein